jgi:hypothetical protein
MADDAEHEAAQMLTTRIRTPATASPFTNLEAPSIEP